MKALLTVLAVLTSIQSFAQAPKDHETITVLLQESPEDAFKTIGRFLVKEGFPLASSEPTLMMLSTEPTKKSMGVLQSALIQLNVVIDGDSTSKAVVSGLWMNPDLYNPVGGVTPTISSNGRVIRNGKKVDRKVFAYVLEMLGTIEGATITFESKN